MPQLATPAALMEPHKIQAALAESILIEGSPYVPDYALALELGIFTLSVLFIWLLLHVFGITWGVVLFMATMASTAFYGYWTIQQGLLIDVTWALISQFITGATAFYLRFREQYKLRQQIKKQFEHYLDPRQVKRLQDNPDLLALTGERKYATFLFTDVRGFTSMSEKLDPTEVTEIINVVLTQQVEAVQKYGGMVDKFIGDAMMAVFNAPLDQEHHEEEAINAGIQIIHNMQKANEELERRGIEERIKIGIGINSGYAVIGNMGSDTRFDYSCIGDSVNLAARLESSTKTVGKDLLIGESTKERSKRSLIKLEPIEVKGKEKLINLYTIDDSAV
jgi:adenylate cyclase